MTDNNTNGGRKKTYVKPALSAFGLLSILTGKAFASGPLTFELP